jgi:hypothetical protein
MELLRKRCDAISKIYRRSIKEMDTSLRETTGPIIRDRLLDVAQKSKALASAIRQAPAWFYLYEAADILGSDDRRQEFLSKLETVAEDAKFAAGEVYIAKGRNSLQEYSFVAFVVSLMNEFSLRKLTTTPGSGFVEISSLLFEYCTEVQGKRFDAACRKMLRRHDDEPS